MPTTSAKSYKKTQAKVTLNPRYPEMPGPALEYGYAVQRFVNLVHLLAKIGFATAENGPRKVSLQPRRGFSKFANKYLPEIDLGTVSL